MNDTNRTTSPIDLITSETKTPGPTPLTLQTEFPEQNRKHTYQGTRTNTHQCQTYHQSKRHRIRRRAS